jgi:hypothetical protein
LRAGITAGACGPHRAGIAFVALNALQTSGALYALGAWIAAQTLKTTGSHRPSGAWSARWANGTNGAHGTIHAAIAFVALQPALALGAGNAISFKTLKTTIAF